MNAMTEQEARGKWCPFARALTTQTIRRGPHRTPEFIAMTAANRDDGDHTNPQYSPCLASNCMSWRWAGWLTAHDADIPRVVRAEGDDLHAIASGCTPFGGTPIGYCGLAGSPTP